MQIEFKKLHPAAKMPVYASEGAACFDLHALEDVILSDSGSCKVRTGLSVAVPDGWVLMVFSRSGHGFNHSVRLSNCVGIIDSDYRGELMIALQSDSCVRFSASAGERIAQAMLMPALRCTFREVDELSETVRGSGGFGSTGK